MDPRPSMADVIRPENSPKTGHHALTKSQFVESLSLSGRIHTYRVTRGERRSLSPLGDQTPDPARGCHQRRDPGSPSMSHTEEFSHGATARTRPVNDPAAHSRSAGSPGDRKST